MKLARDLHRLVDDIVLTWIDSRTQAHLEDERWLRSQQWTHKVTRQHEVECTPGRIWQLRKLESISVLTPQCGERKRVDNDRGRSIRVCGRSSS